MSLHLFQIRVIAEREELSVRVEKLDVFIKSPAFAQVDPEERTRLIKQSDAMKQYESILTERIGAFSAK